MRMPTGVYIAVAFLAATLSGREAQGQARSDPWRPWLGASVGVGSIDVERGSADAGPIAEVALGLAPRIGFGIGARALWWSRPELFSSGEWRAQTYLGFVSYAPAFARAFRVTGGIGGTHARRPTPNAPDLTFTETVLETGLEVAVPRDRPFGLRAFVLREWRLAAGGDAAFVGTGLGQLYLGVGLRVR